MRVDGDWRQFLKTLVVWRRVKSLELEVVVIGALDGIEAVDIERAEGLVCLGGFVNVVERDLFRRPREHEALGLWCIGEFVNGNRECCNLEELNQLS